MKLLNDWEMSWWAYWECKKGNDIAEMRNLIITSEPAYWYCRDIKDIKEMWSKIKYSEDAFKYCRDVEDRYEIWLKIKDIKWMRQYFKVMIELNNGNWSKTVSARWTRLLKCKIHKKDIIIKDLKHVDK